jgi:hypothetical protein
MWDVGLAPIRTQLPSNTGLGGTDDRNSLKALTLTRAPQRTQMKIWAEPLGHGLEAGGLQWPVP